LLIAVYDILPKPDCQAVAPPDAQTVSKSLR